MEAKPTCMPPDVAEVHDRLSKALYYLYTKWKWWRRLWCTDAHTVKLLNYAAGFYFSVSHEVLRDDLILSVCRLTDPEASKVGGVQKENMTFPLLVSRVPQADGSLREEAAKALESLRDQVQVFREHRNRRIGHYDRETVLKVQGSLLSDLSLEAMDGVLADMACILNLVEHHYDQNEHNYEDAIHGSGDANELIDFIQRSVDLEKYYHESEFGDTNYDPLDTE